jgi:hypothetical protein
MERFNEMGEDQVPIAAMDCSGDLLRSCFVNSKAALLVLGSAFDPDGGGLSAGLLGETSVDF